VNFLVPSGGGQWVVQSPVILELANALHVDRAPLVLAFAYGDQTTNLLQPFWALPLLSISGLRAKDIMGYTMLALVVELAIVVPCLVVFAR
jgi:short-chain fatty acids transporter